MAPARGRRRKRLPLLDSGARGAVASPGAAAPCRRGGPSAAKGRDRGALAATLRAARAAFVAAAAAVWPALLLSAPQQAAAEVCHVRLERPHSSISRAVPAPNDAGFVVVTQAGGRIAVEQINDHCKLVEGSEVEVASSDDFLRSPASGLADATSLAPRWSSSPSPPPANPTPEAPSSNADGAESDGDSGEDSDHGSTAVVWISKGDVTVAVVSDGKVSTHQIANRPAVTSYGSSATEPGERTQARVAARSFGGRFFVVWSSWGQDGDAWGVYGRVFSSKGEPIGEERQLNIWWRGLQWRPQLAWCGDHLWAVWESEPSAGCGASSGNASAGHRAPIAAAAALAAAVRRGVKGVSGGAAPDEGQDSTTAADVAAGASFSEECRGMGAAVRYLGEFSANKSLERWPVGPEQFLDCGGLECEIALTCSPEGGGALQLDEISAKTFEHRTFRVPIPVRVVDANGDGPVADSAAEAEAGAPSPPRPSSSLTWGKQRNPRYSSSTGTAVDAASEAMELSKARWPEEDSPEEHPEMDDGEGFTIRRSLQLSPLGQKRGRSLAAGWSFDHSSGEQGSLAVSNNELFVKLSASTAGLYASIIQYSGEWKPVIIPLIQHTPAAAPRAAWDAKKQRLYICFLMKMAHFRGSPSDVWCLQLSAEDLAEGRHGLLGPNMTATQTAVAVAPMMLLLVILVCLRHWSQQRDLRNIRMARDRVWQMRRQLQEQAREREQREALREQIQQIQLVDVPGSFGSRHSRGALTAFAGGAAGNIGPTREVDPGPPAPAGEGGGGSGEDGPGGGGGGGGGDGTSPSEAPSRPRSAEGPDAAAGGAAVATASTAAAVAAAARLSRHQSPMDDSLSCPICQEPVLVRVAWIPCGHTACRDCMLRLVENSARCHICRTPVSGVQPVYL